MMLQTILTVLRLINGRRVGHAHIPITKFKGLVTSKRRKNYGAKENFTHHTLSCEGSLRRRILKSRQQPSPAVSSETRRLWTSEKKNGGLHARPRQQQVLRRS